MGAAQTAAQGVDPAAGRGVTRLPLVVLGGGEHAVVVAEAATSRPDQWELAGYASPAPSVRLERVVPGITWLGEDDAAATGRPDARFVLGFGGGIRPGDRSVVVQRCDGVAWARVIHATAWIAPSAVVEDGAFINAGAVIQSGAHVGPHAVVNSAAIVEHDVAVGAYAHLAPGAVVGGGSRIGAGAFVGLGARIRDHVTIGDGAVVAMGAVVVGDVAAGARVAGVPARPMAPGSAPDHPPADRRSE